MAGLCSHAPVLHEDVDPDYGSNEEDSSHVQVEAGQRDFCCRQEASWILLSHSHLWFDTLSCM